MTINVPIISSVAILNGMTVRNDAVSTIPEIISGTVTTIPIN